MMSWQPRMIERKPFIFGPRGGTPSWRLVRTCQESGSPMSTAARLRIPSAAMQLLEPGAAQTELLGRLAGGGHEAHRHRLLHPVDDEDVAHLGMALHARRLVAPRRIDVIDVGIGRLRDVGVGGD